MDMLQNRCYILASYRMDISYESENDISNIVYKFQFMCGTIHRTLRNKTTREQNKQKF